MNAFMLSTRAELSKLLSKKKYIVFTALCALVSLIYIAVPAALSRISGGHFSLRPNIVMLMLGVVTDILVPLIAFMAVTDLFATEAHDDTMKLAIMRPITRLGLMLSKSLAAFVMAAVSALAVFVVCLVMQLVSGGSLRYAGAALGAYLIDLIPAAAVVGMAVLINVIVQKPPLAMLLCMGVYAFFKYLNYYVSPAGQMIFTAYSQWHRIWIGRALPVGALASKAGIVSGSLLLLFAVAYVIFDKKDY